MAGPPTSSHESTAKAVSTLPALWVDHHGDALFRFAMMRVRNADTAEDLVQETFLAALGARERFTEAASERTWLIAILRNKIVNHIRSASRQPTVDAGCDSQSAGEAFFDRRGLWKQGPKKWSINPTDLSERSEFWEVFQQCLAKLPPRLADAYVLREIEQMSSEKVCEVLGVSANNLWTQTHRARMMLRSCLEEHWFLDRSPEKRT